MVDLKAKPYFLNDEDISNNQLDINPFNFQCDKILLKELVAFLNGKKIFENYITLQDVSMFFSCKKNGKFKLRNGMTKSFVYILYFYPQMCARNTRKGGEIPLSCRKSRN